MIFIAKREAAAGFDNYGELLSVNDIGRLVFIVRPGGALTTPIVSAFIDSPAIWTIGVA